MKYRVAVDTSIVVGQGEEQSFKAGVHETTENNREALEHLASIGLAEPVRASDKEE